VFGADLPDHGEPAAVGHVHVEQDHVGAGLADQLNGLADGPSFADHVDELRELRPHSRAEQRVVVDDHDSRPLAHRRSSQRITSQPSPGSLRISA
jgi:hypothetical protein